MHLRAINEIGPNNNPTTPNNLKPANIAISVISGWTPNSSLTSFGSIKFRITVIVIYVPINNKPHPKLPVIKYINPHGINIVPTPKTGNISTIAVIIDNTSGYGTTMPNFGKINLYTINTSINVIKIIFVYI